MEKQYNPLLSFPVMIKQTIFLKNEAKALQIILKKYTEKEINQIMPSAIQNYLSSKQFDRETASEAKKVVQKYKHHFSAQFSKEIKDIEKLNGKIEKTYKCLDQAKKNVRNKRQFTCQICEKTYSTENGLHYHRRSQRCARKPSVNSLSEQNQLEIKPKGKKIKKQLAREKIHKQESQDFVESNEEFLE